MNKRQQNQLTEIKKSIDDLIKNYPNIYLFVNIIKTEFDLEYPAIGRKPVVESYLIDKFIQNYQDKIKDLYGLIK